jgi:hypothetical protein
MAFMEESHSGDKNDDFAQAAQFVRARLHFFNTVYDVDGVHLKNF